MPDHSRYDLDYRPRSYWVFENEDQRIGATVKGTFRRHMARLSLQGDVLGDMEPFRFNSALPEGVREMRMAMDPVLGSGEYLEDLEEGAVEIARVIYRSTFTDVVSGRLVHGADAGSV